ncbi:hypothetical protein E4U21_005319 [Claviceps maximensis]|nr:hypothetical protein E4U21_005319 [Claviceps maximensis]
MGSEASASGSCGPDTSSDMEPLACVVCRSRKLKCDRTKPACTRCRTVGGECVYPGARRKPTFKRRNVKEIESRLAQVESYLKQVTNSRTTDERHESAPASLLQEDLQDPSEAQPAPAPAPGFGFSDYANPPQHRSTPDSNENYALIGLGYSESLPPLDVQEELPMRKPPMSLQYAIWATAATGHAKYDQYAEIFYKRARHYMEADEMKDHGEHFITIPHAQALCLCAAFEAKLMLFTRAATTCAKAVRLCQMMGLDRLDGARDDLPPSLGPHTSWEELEERRRVFWGVFATDSHASISTGWPALINPEDIVTRLPASEEAFASGREEVSPFLEQTFSGSSYSAFAATTIVCQIFRVILKHVHRCKPSDHPEDMLDGPFWNRHRELDNKLSSTFMFLPSKFVLPRALRDPGAIHMNLNLHAAVIILHHAALEKMEQHDLSSTVMETSLCRLRASAEAIVNIIKMTSHYTSIFKSPLCALSLYCCTTVYVYLAKRKPSDSFTAQDKSNLEIIIQAMEVIGRKHEITSAFLQQACLDIERNDLTLMFRSPTVDRYRHFFDGTVGSNIPLITRSSVSSHSKVTPVLPGRLPLSNPQGKIWPSRLQVDKNKSQSSSLGQSENHGARGCINTDCFQSVLGAVTRNVGSGTGKKRRMSPDSSTTTTTTTTTPSFIVPDRTNSSTSLSTHKQAQGPCIVQSSSSSDLSGSAHFTPPGLGNTSEENRIDLRAFQERMPQTWQAAQMQAMQDTLFTSSVSESLFSMAGYDGTTMPTTWDTWAETMAWEGDNSMSNL